MTIISLISNFFIGKRKFSFRGCGWKPINTRMWTKEKQEWILAIDNLFSQMFGNDFLTYAYDKSKGTSVEGHILSGLVDYNHDQWESRYLETLASAQQGEFTDTEFTMGCPDSAKQLVFTDGEVVSAKSCPSTEVSDGNCIAAKTSQEVLIK